MTTERETEALAEWLGEMPESRNVFDVTDEAETVISIDVETLAERIASRLADHNAHIVAEAEARGAERVVIAIQRMFWRYPGPLSEHPVVAAARRAALADSEGEA